MARASKSKAAYFLVDLTDLSDDIRSEVLEDALAGGGEFGVKVVEEVHNGSARQSLFGVYYGDDEDKWNAAKKDLGITGSDVEDGEVQAEGGVDPRTEAALRQAAEEQAAADAEAARVAEDLAVQQVVDGGGADSNAPTKNKAKR